MPLAVKMIYALSIHRLTTGDIQVRAGLTSENMRDDLCLYLPGLPDQSSDTLQTLVQAVLKDVMTTVSGQFIDYDAHNGQYYLDLKKDVDYDEKITQRAATLSDDKLNSYFFDIIYFCLEWEGKARLTNYRIYDYTLNWDSHKIFRRGYLFFGKPEERTTAQPPEDYYIYFVPPYGNVDYTDDKKSDEVFFVFKPNEEFKNDLKLYAAACNMHDLAEEKNKAAYRGKSEIYRKKLTRFLTENKNTCFHAVYGGVKKQLPEILKGRYKPDDQLKDTIDLVSSLMLDYWFNEKYPEFPVMKTVITEKNRAEAVRRAFERFSGRKEQLGNYMLDSFGLLSGENITIHSSKHAQYYAKLLDDLSVGAVLNFNDIYEEIPSSSEVDTFFDKKFSIGHLMLPIVLLGLVYTGRAIITLKNGEAITASDLDNIHKMNVSDICGFKHISKPKGLPLGQLVRLFEVLGLPEGQIRNEQSRETGVEELVAKAQEVVNNAVSAKSKLDGDFLLWGEPLISLHTSANYKDAAKRVNEMLGNFHSRFNTVAKLNNFIYSMADVEKLGEDIKTVSIILEYDAFRKECHENVNYMVSIESVEDVKQRIVVAKDAFRKIRDEIAGGKYGETAAMEVNGELSSVKDAYIDIYFEEHKKRRLDVKGGQHKGELISSTKYANLTRLADIEVLTATKLTMISNELAALKTCIDLTPTVLKTSFICPKCSYHLGNADPLVKGAVEKIEDRLDALTEEWTKTLLSSITDPLVLPNMGILSPEKRQLIDAFIETKALPEKVDSYFVSTVNELLQEYETVDVDGDKLINWLSSLGPCNEEAFKAKIEQYVAELTKGKDKSKLRIIVR
jgi:hypothetical protein